VSFIDGVSRDQISLLPACIDDYVAHAALVRVVDAFVASLDLVEPGFKRVAAAATGRPGYQPGDMLRLYIWGYLNQVRSSRHLERACVRDLEALWLMRRLTPDYRTIAAFRHDNPEAIIAASAAFVQFCREQGLVGGPVVAVDGTKMRAVASPKNIAGAERLARDIAHTEKEIAYYLDRLDIIDETVAQSFDDQPLHRENFAAAIASLQRRKDRLARRQQGAGASRGKGSRLRRARGQADGLGSRSRSMKGAGWNPSSTTLPVSRSIVMNASPIGNSEVMMSGRGFSAT
jgi:transposase